MEPLIGALSHNEATVHRSTAIVLGRIGDIRAVEALGMALYDLHHNVGNAAAETLAPFGAAAIEVLMRRSVIPKRPFVCAPSPHGRKSAPRASRLCS